MTDSSERVDLGEVDFAAKLPQLVPGGLSRDCRRLLVSRHRPDPHGPQVTTDLWEVDTTGDSPARQLSTTHNLGGVAYFGDSVVGVTAPEATGNQGRDSTTPDEHGRQLCRLRDDGTLQPLTDLPGGCQLLAAGPAPVAVVVTRPETRAAAVRDRLGVTAEWHESFPAKRLGQPHDPAPARLLVIREDADPLDVTPDVGTEAFGMRAGAAPAVLSPDGDVLALARAVADGWATRTVTLLVNTRTGRCTTGLDVPGRNVVPRRFSADGTTLICTSAGPIDVDTPTGLMAHTLDVATGETRALFGGVSPCLWDAIPTADGQQVIALSDEAGHAALDLVDPATGIGRRLDPQLDSHMMPLAATPDGRAIIAWDSRFDRPPRPVRIDIPDGSVTALTIPRPTIVHPGMLDEQWAHLPDGRGRVHGLLALPKPTDADQRVPLLVFLHGGPGGAWGTWTAGWSPWPAVARGYAVLLANIAPSTGYGDQAMSRAWPMKGHESLQDLLALLDQLHADHPRIAPDRVGVLGCSHGGFLVNWFAGATDRFRAAVSLSGIWDLPSMQQTSDLVDPLAAPEDLASGSPRLQVESIRTPMLIVHGQQDHRVPLSQAIWQWRDLLTAHAGRDDGSPQPHRFLIFPDEHHVVTRPHNLTCWWQTVLAFADTHVRGSAWQWPALLDPRPAPTAPPTDATNAASHRQGAH